MKVLIIQIRQMGDVLLSAPLAEAIKNSFRDSTVHFLTSSSSYDILSLNPNIDKILTIKDGLYNEIRTILSIRKEKYDAVIDVQRTGRSKRISLFSSSKLKIAFRKGADNFYYNRLIDRKTHGYTVFERMDLLEGIGITEKCKCMPKLFFSDKDLENVKIYLKNKNIEKFFIVAPTARKKVKMWSVEEFGKLANKIYKTTNMTPIITYGTKSEKDVAVKCAKYAKKAHVAEKPFSIKEFAALVSLSEFFIGNDSFPAHVAVSQNTKTIVVCGPSSGWFLENEKTKSIYKGLECQPCNDYKSCKFDMLCYKSLKFNEVFEKISGFIQ